MKDREQLGQSRRWVIKIGSAMLAAPGGHGLNEALIGDLAEQMAALADDGRELLLVSSGAVAAGMHRLRWSARPRELHELQAAAAVGQSGLVQAYESAFRHHEITTAQVLLTHDDLANRRRYLNARSALRTLLGLRVVPIINENDTVAIDELRFGDNDTLAAMVANLVEADLLVILTDQQGLYEKDPRQHADAGPHDAYQPLLRAEQPGIPHARRAGDRIKHSGPRSFKCRTSGRYAGGSDHLSANSSAGER